MSTFPYRSILFHTIADGKGWFIIGIKHDGVNQTLAMIMPTVGWELARHWADQAAKNLAGETYADLD